MMIQKLKKAQALTEMAVFGALILLSLNYLLSYLQRMNAQQYVVQEAFRGALENAHEKGFVNYTVFSNKRTASIYNPSGGDRSLVSGSGSVLWGQGGDSSILYKFNKDERDLTDILGSDKEEDEDRDNPLVDNDEPDGGDKEISIDIEAETDRKRVTKVTRNSANVTTRQTSQVNDWIEFSIVNEKDGSTLYAIKQGLGDDGQYSVDDLGKDIPNVMTGGKPRVWGASN